MAAYLMLGSFFPKGDYTQLLRLADLGRHFHLHVQEARSAGQEVSFQRFLHMHYFDTQIHQGDHEQDHEDLPFQHITPTIDQMTPVVWRLLQLSPPLIEQRAPASHCLLHLRGFSSSIFHPPIV